ncbi:MAG: hypothetical protein WCK98_04080 [bacterium]
MQKEIPNIQTKPKFGSFQNLAVYVLFVVFVVSFFGIINGATREYFTSKVEIFLWIVGFLNLYFLLSNQEKLNSYKIQLWLITSIVSTFLVQVIIQNISSTGLPLFQSSLFGNNKGISFLDVSIILCLVNSLNILASWQISIRLLDFIKDKFKVGSHLESKTLKAVIAVTLASTIFIVAKFLNQIDLIKKAFNLSYSATINGAYQYFSIQQIVTFNALSFLMTFALVSLAYLMGLKIKSFFLQYSFILELIFILSLAFLL